MVVVLVGGSAGWRKLRLLQCLLSQLQIDVRGGQKVKDYRRLPLPFPSDKRISSKLLLGCKNQDRGNTRVSDSSHTNHPAM